MDPKSGAKQIRIKYIRPEYIEQLFIAPIQPVSLIYSACLPACFEVQIMNKKKRRGKKKNAHEWSVKAKQKETYLSIKNYQAAFCTCVDPFDDLHNFRLPLASK